MSPTNALPLHTSLPKKMPATPIYPIPYILQQQSTVAALACTAARCKVGASGFSIGGAQQIILKREEEEEEKATKVLKGEEKGVGNGRWHYAADANRRWEEEGVEELKWG